MLQNTLPQSKNTYLPHHVCETQELNIPNKLYFQLLPIIEVVKYIGYLTTSIIGKS